MKLVMLGAPGSGKGTQAEIISKKFNLHHISIGELLRKNINDDNDVDSKTKTLIDKGHLAPNSVITRILKKYLPKDNFILDGYPRSIEQALILDDINVKIDKVILLDLDDDVIIERLTGRIVCPQCGAVYHCVYKRPLVSNICDMCGCGLIQRNDDTHEVVLERLKLYHETIELILDFYNSYDYVGKFSVDKRSFFDEMVFKINASGDVNEITDRISKFIFLMRQ
jgi:adenylate kinase